MRITLLWTPVLTSVDMHSWCMCPLTWCPHESIQSCREGSVSENPPVLVFISVFSVYHVWGGRQHRSSSPWAFEIVLSADSGTSCILLLSGNNCWGHLASVSWGAYGRWRWLSFIQSQASQDICGWITNLMRWCLGARDFMVHGGFLTPATTSPQQQFHVSPPTRFKASISALDITTCKL